MTEPSMVALMRQVADTCDRANIAPVRVTVDSGLTGSPNVNILTRTRTDLFARILHPAGTGDQALDDELVAHAQGRPLIDRVFPPDQCDDTWVARYYDDIDRSRP